MYEGKNRTLFAKYAIPQMIGLLFNSVYIIVDGIFIGNRLGREAMAAAAVGVPLVEILIALSMAIASGAGILISGQLARREQEKAVPPFSARSASEPPSLRWAIFSCTRSRTPLARRRKSMTTRSATCATS